MAMGSKKLKNCKAAFANLQKKYISNVCRETTTQKLRALAINDFVENNNFEKDAQNKLTKQIQITGLQANKECRTDAFKNEC